MSALSVHISFCDSIKKVIRIIEMKLNIPGVLLFKSVT